MRNNKLIFNLALSIIAAIVIMIYMASCANQRTAQEEKNKEAIRREFEEAWNKGNLDVLDGHIAAEFVRHSPPNPDIKGLDGLKNYIENIPERYSTFHVIIDEIFSDADRTLARFTLKATPKGQQKEVSMAGTSVDHWRDGKVIERWVYMDHLGFMQQLGYKMTPPIAQNTFARVTVTKMKPEKVSEAVKIYGESVVPDAQKQKGFRGIFLLSDFKTGKGLSIAIWDSEADAIANEQSGYYQTQVGRFKDFFTAKPVREGYVVTVQE